ncbi:protease pro-enzyme activation domain-containing protein [Jatrophihabitans endophyticus]|uniref:S53 family peptidase n=1 Tax=Jatrophihabitans endophyticus TaxID=1206085 RepID=UPI001A06AA32|nr:S53 family peptidase [Jatrophihabitans endophyticus]MBE7188421.1 S8/S53 family peptidase [Jatrophihabitans endophyticus]
MSRTSPRRIAATVSVSAAAVLAAGVALAVPQAADAAPAWASTSTQALSLTTSATELGAAPAATPLRLTLGLTPRHRSELNSLIAAQATKGSGQYGKYLTPAQFTSRFAATKATASTVRSYLTEEGMSGVTVSKNRLVVTANSTAAQAEKAFHTSIARFRQAKRTVLANTAAAFVPASMKGMVDSVLGLSTLGVQDGPSLPGLSTPKTAFDPKDFDTVYHAGGTTAGKGSTLAIIAEGDLTPTVKDLRLAEAKNKLPQVPVSLRYAGVKSSDTSGADEWDLDTQTSTGIANTVNKLDIYVATSLSDSDLARALNMFASQDVAQAGSASLGECDALPFADGAMTVDDIIFAEAAAQGQTFFASSGDTGSACAVLPTNGVPGAGLPDTEYPASSPYVVGVGGTTLDANAKNRYQTEIAWNAGGGGASPIENAPSWQSGVVPTVNSTLPLTLRGVPDVAFDADPDTGENVYVDGTSEEIGGTSLASPLALGLWTRLQSTHGNKLGFAAPKLYALYTKAQNGSPLPPTSVPGFHDIVLGVNGTYTALPGYDYTTGLGSWDVAALSKALG